MNIALASAAVLVATAIGVTVMLLVRRRAPDGSYFKDEYLVEKTETKEGWSYPSPDEDMVTGYPDELRDFVGAISHGRAPKSDLMLAHDVLLVTYAAYLSAEKGARIDIRPFLKA